jgi:hypothetical protein
VTPIEQVLELARWAPSGDNTQPWRFEICSPDEAIIHTFDTRRHCVYDLDGMPSQISVGALLETARIAATAQHMRADIERLPSQTEERLRFRVRLVPDGTVEPCPLLPHIERRSTQRRPLARRALTLEQKAALEASVGPTFRLLWLEGSRRWAMARLMFESAKIRLTTPEAYAVHRDVIEWHARTSEAKIPDQAVGLDPGGLALMRWAMKSWSRTRILCTYFGGTLLPRVQLDLLPALWCGAHVLICAQETSGSVDDHLNAGAAVQRLWLTAELLGLRHQPEMTPLIFARYHHEGREFSVDPRAFDRAGRIRQRLAAVTGERNPAATVWVGRIGVGPSPRARSLRRPLSSLILVQP